MKRIIIIGLVFLLSILPGSATNYNLYQTVDGLGTFSQHLETTTTYTDQFYYHVDGSGTLYIYWYYRCHGNGGYTKLYRQTTLIYYGLEEGCPCEDGMSGVFSAGKTLRSFIVWCGGSMHTMVHTYIVSDTPLTGYTISGNYNCLDNVYIYLKLSDNTYTYFGKDITDNDYSFEILYNQTYKLVFSDDYEYEFTCEGNEEYDHDVCDYCTINLLDDCANMLINPTVRITRPDYFGTGWLIYEGSDNPIELLPDTDFTDGDKLDILISTTDGSEMKTIFGTIGEFNLYHQSISWNLNVHVIDDNTGANILQAKVTRTQDCCIVGTPSGYALTQTNGHVIFTGLANLNIDLTVEKSGYNTYSKTVNVGSIFNCWSGGGGFTVYMNATIGESTDDFNNGTHNDSLDIDGDGNETLPENHAWGCGVYFKNTDGVITDTINDTDAYVDMYWWTKGCPATLKFQHQIYTYWYTDLEYSVANNSYEYRRILNANFSDYTDAYRGFIYNSSCECNDIQNLYVINYTYEEETHYENLTAHCWIKNKLSGNEIDYRSDIKCVIYANSTNSTLLDITANFMNGSTLVDSIVLNWADFVSGSPKWYYTWYPDYEYTTGHNYTLNITGFDGYQLDTDEVWTADIIGNELTVFVKDNYNQQIDYATIFIEDWGSIATGSYNYATVTGLPDGDYQYKATKSGYITSGWATITLTEHESVTCVLVEIAETSVIGQKMSDTQIKSIFIPLMYILFIFMILGAFKYAN